MEPTTQDAGIARANEEALAAARDGAIKAERERRQQIQLAAAKFTHQLPENFTNNLIDTGVTLEDARTRILDQLSATFTDTSTRAENVRVTRDGNETKFSQMQSAVLLRYMPKFGLSKKVDVHGSPTQEFISGYGPEYQQKLEAEAREYRGYSLFEMAKEALALRGINTRGMSKDKIAQLALQRWAAKRISRVARNPRATSQPFSRTC